MIVPVPGGVAVGRVVAAADVTAGHAHPKVHPSAAGSNAVLAAVARRRDVLDGLEVDTGTRHRAALRVRFDVAGIPGGPPCRCSVGRGVVERAEGDVAVYDEDGAGRLPEDADGHASEDRDHWLASPKREAAFATIGVTGIRTFVDPENPNKVGLIAEVPDLDALNEAMQGPEFGEAMAHDGVLPETVVILVES